MMRAFEKISMTRGCRIRALALVVAISLQIPATFGCGGQRVPDLSKVFASARKETGKRPIILVPGILNIALVNSKNRETVWPSACTYLETGGSRGPLWVKT